MKSLVQFIHYSPKEITSLYVRTGSFFPPAEIKRSLVINSPPKNILEATIQTHFLQSYLGVEPWFVKITPSRQYLAISSLDESFEGQSFEYFLGHPALLFARRGNPLDDSQRKGLIENILSTLSSENSRGLFRDKSEQAAQAYSDVLQALGENVSEEQVKEMISKQETEGDWPIMPPCPFSLSEMPGMS